MLNLNEMTSKELKEMAKSWGVKNWWNLKKSELITEIAFAMADAEEAAEETTEEATEETEAPKEVKKPSLKIKELTFEGRTQTIREWAAELEMPWPTLYDRINRNGWTVEEALTTPLGGRRQKNKVEA